MKFSLHSILALFKSLNKKQQYAFSGGIALLIFLISFYTVSLLTPGFAVLFNSLDPVDAQQIIKHLDSEHIEYRISNQGQDIRIPANLIEKTRLNLLGKGMQFSGTVGFELFDKSDFGMTDFSQKINLQRALQGELERTINSLEEVQQSRVHLVIPENRIFQDTKNPPKASVTLHLRSPLNKTQIESIQQLIHASVPHLEAAQVILVDQHGNRLSGFKRNPETVWFSQKRNLEIYFKEKVTQTLQTLFAPDQVIVQVDLTLNHDQKELEFIKPETKGTVTHEKEIQHSSTSKMEKASSTKDITREKSYQSGTHKEHIIQASGTIERLSVGVLLPEKTRPDQLAHIRELVKSIVGFQEKRGDSIQVEALLPERVAIKDPIIPASTPSSGRDFPFPVTNILGIMILSGAFCLIVRHQYIRKKRKILLQELMLWLETYEK